MSEEKNEKLKIESSSTLSVNEEFIEATSSATNNNDGVSSSSKLSQNSIEACGNVNLDNNDGSTSKPGKLNSGKLIMSSTQVVPNLSKWMATNVQSISKFLNLTPKPSNIQTEDGRTNHDSQPGTSSELKEINIGTTEFPQVVALTFTTTVHKPSSIQGTSTSSYHHVGKNPFSKESVRVSSSENNRPSSSRSVPTNEVMNLQTQEILILSQELTSSEPGKPVEDVSMSVVLPRITEIINRSLISASESVVENYREEEEVSISRSFENDLMVRGQAIPIDTESALEILISPPPYPPRIVNGPPSISGAPPSYSAIMRLGAESMWDRRVGVRPSPPFIAPPPPPGYTQVLGYNERIAYGIEDEESYSDWIRYTLDQIVWGSDPITMICPRCSNVIVTSIFSRRSGLSHLSAIAMFFCGCWPCCLLPYCMDSCKNTYHYCPRCNAFLGVYRPWGETQSLMMND